jgi:hypothetical protein
MRRTTELELLLRDGRIRLMDDARKTVESILFHGSRVAAVGPTDEILDVAASPTDIDLGGHTVLPGFSDAPTHTFSVGIELIETNLSVADSREESLERLAANAEETPAGAWVLRVQLRREHVANGRPVVSRTRRPGRATGETGPHPRTRILRHRWDWNRHSRRRRSDVGSRQPVPPSPIRIAANAGTRPRETGRSNPEDDPWTVALRHRRWITCICL